MAPHTLPCLFGVRRGEVRRCRGSLGCGCGFPVGGRKLRQEALGWVGCVCLCLSGGGAWQATPSSQGLGQVLRSRRALVKSTGTRRWPSHTQDRGRPGRGAALARAPPAPACLAPQRSAFGWFLPPLMVPVPSASVYHPPGCLQPLASLPPGAQNQQRPGEEKEGPPSFGAARDPGAGDRPPTIRFPKVAADVRPPGVT